MSATLPPKNTVQLGIAYVDWILWDPSLKLRDGKSSTVSNVKTRSKTNSHVVTDQSPRAVPGDVDTRVGETTEIDAALEIGIRDFVDPIAPGGMQVFADCIEIVGEAWYAFGSSRTCCP